MTSQYDSFVQEAGKGLAPLHRSEGSVVLANGTVNVHIDSPPVAFKIRRVLVSSPVATDLTSFDVMVHAPGTDLDTAAGAGNQVITQLAAIADKKVNSQALTSYGKGTFAANSPIVAQGVHNAAVPTGPVTVVVEWVPVGDDKKAYGGGAMAKGTYE